MNAIVSALLVLVLAVLSFWTLQNLERAERVVKGPEAHEPDYFLDNMVRTTTGAAGELVNILHASRVEHFPDDDSTELADPHLEIYNGGPQPWHVIAERGWISSGNDVVLLHGEVEIWRTDDEGHRIYEVLTTELRVLPKEQYAETDSPTIIIGPETVTKSIGMRANFSHSRLELVDRVRSKYETRPRS